MFIKKIKKIRIIKITYINLRKVFLYFNFVVDFFKFKRVDNERFVIKWKDRLACLGDKTKETNYDRHYIYHTAWASRIIKENNPNLHIDISSALYFSTILSAFVPVDFYDYRPVDIKLSGLNSKKADILNLPFNSNSIDSLSCMHVIEHIGLGRYGDSTNPDGDLKAISELKRVLAVNGNLFFVVPVGKPKIVFNGHRIYSYDQIVSYFSDLKLEIFSLILDDSNNDIDFIKDATKELADQQKYGCGCFWFKKVI